MHRTLTLQDVFPQDGDMTITVRAGLLVHEAQGVHKFVGGHAGPHAEWRLQGEELAAPGLPQVRPAT